MMRKQIKPISHVRQRLLRSLPLIAGLLCTASVSAKDAPVKVYILAGQSNMVGIGGIDGGASRWGESMFDPVLSVYPGSYDSTVDYDKMEPSNVQKIEKFGGANPGSYTGEGVKIVRGKVKMPETGVYEFRPGWGGSTVNIMEVDGQEVHRNEPGGELQRSPIKLEAGKAVPFKITFLTHHAGSVGWIARLDVPGTLKTVVLEEGKFQYLVDDEGNFVPRDDVWYKGVVTATANQWLNIGCGGA
jgi:hypothetical protein